MYKYLSNGNKLYSFFISQHLELWSLFMNGSAHLNNVLFKDINTLTVDPRRMKDFKMHHKAISFIINGITFKEYVRL